MFTQVSKIYKVTEKINPLRKVRFLSNVESYTKLIGE